MVQTVSPKEKVPSAQETVFPDQFPVCWDSPVSPLKTVLFSTGENSCFLFQREPPPSGDLYSALFGSSLAEVFWQTGGSGSARISCASSLRRAMTAFLTRKAEISPRPLLRVQVTEAPGIKPRSRSRETIAGCSGSQCITADCPGISRLRGFNIESHHKNRRYYFI